MELSSPNIKNVFKFSQKNAFLIFPEIARLVGIFHHKIIYKYEKIKKIQLKYSIKQDIYKIMAGMTQKELRKPYFYRDLF